jgi:hypothetical protein
MPLRYQSGDEVKKGDRILYAGERGTIDFVVSPDNPEHSWYVKQYGAGCMILVTPFGSLFLTHPQDDEDLDFVARGES